MLLSHASRAFFVRFLIAAMASIVVLLGFSAQANAQLDTFGLGDADGGAFTATAGTTTLNHAAPITAAVSAGSSSVTIGTVRTGNYTSVAGLANDRLVLVVQSTNFTGTATDGSATAIDLTSNQVGSWELAEVSSVVGPTVTFSAPLVNSYAATGAQIVTIPEFTTATIGAGNIVNGPAWDGSSGGFVGFLATGAVSISGTLTSAGRGFRQGTIRNTTATGCAQMVQGNNNRKGEGIVPSHYDPAGGDTSNGVGAGNKANSGGGGNCAEGGGGGGSSHGAGGKGGNTSDGNRDFGGRGGAPLTYSAYNHFVFGGGGGSGDDNTGANGAGGVGGGVVFVRGASLGGTGTLSAAGNNGANSTAEAASAGGGGAGGVVYARFSGAVACTSVTVAGGNGGSVSSAGAGNQGSPGGGAGGGKILIQGTSIACAASNGGGANGTLPGGSADGAVAGSAGNTISNATGFVKPVAAITSPANGAYVATTGPTITGTATAGSTVNVYVDGVNVGSATADGSGNWSYSSAGLAQGAHTVYVQSVLDSSYSDPTSTNNFTVDTVAPVVSISSPTTGSYIQTATPSVTFSVTETNLGTTECRVDTGTWTACSSAWVTPAMTAGVHTLNVRHTDLAGNVGSSSVSVTVDLTNPVVTISSPAAASYTNDNTPDITFSVTETNLGTSRCRVDGGAWTTPCTSAWTTSTLSNGSHTVDVEHTDLSGRVGSASRTFTVDTILPVVSLTGPTNGSYVSTATPAVTFSVTETNQGTSQCRVDGGAWTTCTSGWTPPALTAGSHTIDVRHTDLANNTSTVQSTTFTVDLTNPVVSISSPAAASYTNDTTPDITFSVTEANQGTTRCRVDGGAWTTPCTSPWTTGTLSSGSHTVEVEHTDLAGRVGSATRTFTVDAVAPVVSISSPTPSAYVSTATPAVSFSVTETNQGTTECSINGSSWTACSSPWTATAMAEGARTVYVRHTDLAGNVGSATQNITVDLTNPVVDITSPADNSTTSDTTPTINFSVTETNAGTTECRIDGGSWSTCSSGWTPGPLSDGTYDFEVRHTDLAGRTGSDLITLTIDATDPVVDINSPVGGSFITDPTPQLDFDVTDSTTTTTTCELNGGTPFACNSGDDLSTLADGVYTLVVTATDEAGNSDDDTVTFTVDTTDPIVTISAPVNNSTTSDDTPEITFSVNDATATSTTCSIDGGTPFACASGDSLSTLADGTYTLTVTATDAAGNSDDDTVSFTVDTTDPVVTISAPVNGSHIDDSTPEITFSVNDATATSTTCTVNGGTPFACTSGDLLNLSDGTYTLVVTATDAAGNADDDTVTFTVDTTDPLVSISTPANGSSTTDTTPQLTFTASDTNNLTITCTIDGGTPFTCASGDDLPTLTEGSHTLVVTVEDDAGNFASDVSVFNVDLSDPVVDINTPANGSTTADSTPALDFDVTDATATTTTCSLNGDAPFACNSGDDLPTLADGVYTLVVTATDAAGNDADDTVTFTVDTTDPVVAISAPVNNSTTSDDTPEITFSVNDATSTSTTCSIDGGTPFACASGDSLSTLADGTYTLTVTATDAAGNDADDTVTFTVDTTDPVVAISAPANNSTTSDDTPEITFSVNDATATSTTCSIDGGTPFACASGDSLASLADGTYALVVTATDAAGNSDDDTVTFTVDTVNPVVDITAPADGSTTSDDTPEITFSVNDATATSTTCSIDGGTPFACASGDSLSTLADGTYTLVVAALDAAGNGSSDTVTFTVDTTDPVVAISAPVDNSTTSDDTPEITFTVNDATNTTTTCTIDGGTPFACASGDSLASLADGTYVLEVTALDEAGNSDSDSVTFTVDTTDPVVAISAPVNNSTTSDDTPEITFSVNDATATSTTCSIDGGTPFACASGDSLSTLADGTYTLTVTATDAAGNDADDTVTFTIDTTDPVVAISAPVDNSTTSDDTPEITFSVNDATATSTTCSIDGGTPFACASGDSLSTLADGTYTLTVTATDAAGNDADDTVTFTVDTTNPVVAISAPADGSSTSDDTPEITFSVNDATATSTTCSIDGGTPFACASGDSLSTLADGTYTLRVTATDAADNSSFDEVTFTVDTTNPVVNVTAPADGSTTDDDTPEITFSVNDATATTTTCSIDGGTPFACASGDSLSTLADGTYTLRVTATDAADNSSFDEVTFTVDTTDPVVEISAPADGSTTQDSTPPVTFSVTDATSTTATCAIDGGTPFPCSSGDDLPTLSDGPHTLVVTVTDAAGNSDDDTVSFTVDTTDPVVSISTPVNGSTTSDTTPQVTFSVTDATSTSTTCAIDGGMPFPCDSGDDLPTLSDGPHTLVVTVVDAAGNSDDDTVSFTVDTSLPTVVIDSPANGAHIDSSSVTVEYTSTDNGTLTTTCTLNGDPVVCDENSAELTGLADGTYTFVVTVEDDGGNFASAPVTFTVDTTDPVVDITSPADGSTTIDTTPAVFFDVTDTNDTTTTCSIDGGTPFACVSGDDLSTLADGTYTLRVTATDEAGNSSFDEVTFTIDTTDPVVAISAPADGSTIDDDTPQITFSVTDATDTITSCSIDGGAPFACASGDSLSTLADGTYTLRVTATDEADNSGFDEVTFTVDTTDPVVAISAPVDGSVTNDTTPPLTFSVTDATSTSAMCAIDGGTPFACASGDDLPTLTEGPHTLVVTVTDAAGNTDTDEVTFTVDLTPPSISIDQPSGPVDTATPTFSGTTDAPDGATVTVTDGPTTLCTATVSGGTWSCTSTVSLPEGPTTVTASVSDPAGNIGDDQAVIDVDLTAPAIAISAPSGLINNATPLISGTTDADDGTEVTVTVGSTTVCTATVSGGTWSCTPSSDLAEGAQTLTASIEDEAGNVATATSNITVDTTPPTITIDQPDGPVNTDLPTFEGTTDAPDGSTVTVTDGVDTLCTAVVSGGAWSCTSTVQLGEGTTTVTASVSDPAGNPGSDQADIDVDLTPPTIAISAPSGLINDATPQISGTTDADDGTTVTVTVGVTTVCTATASGGNWSCTPSSDLTEGAQTLTATVEDEAGNVATATSNIDVDTTAPAAPTIDSPVSPHATANNQPTFSGTGGQPNRTVRLYRGTTLIGTTTADGSGNWSITPSTPIPDGEHDVTATTEDEAGNESGPSNTLELTIDTTPPNTTITDAPSSPSSDATPTFEFESNESGSTFECRIDGLPVGWEPCSSGFTATTLGDGVHLFEVRAIDALGNVDPTPATHSWTIDTTPPAAPVITAPANGTATNDSTPQISGTGTPGAHINVYVDGGSTPICTATVNGGGNWTCTPTTPLTEGDHELTATAEDDLGNESVPSNEVDLTIDTIAPTGTITQGGTPENPVFDITSDDPTATMACVLSPGGAVPCSPPTWIPTGLGPGDYTLTITYTDGVGNSTVRAINFRIPGPPVTPPQADPTACFAKGVTIYNLKVKGKKLTISGFARSSYAGKEVTINFQPTKSKVIGKTTVKADGSFTATVPAPAKKLWKKGTTRYRANVPGESSLWFKFDRRMGSNEATFSGGSLKVAGFLSKPLDPKATLTVTARTGCNEPWKKIGTAKINPRTGAFSASIPYNPTTGVAFVRMYAKVRKTAKSKKTMTTYSFVIPVITPNN